MGLIYLDGKEWWEVTREERFFCAHLYQRIQECGVPAFVRFLNQKAKLNLDENAEWCVAYEACFYRDLWHLKKRRNHDPGTLHSPKRTFDLCLLSEKAIVIIEAKAHENFDPDQLARLEKDREAVSKATGVSDIFLVGLASSKFEPGERVRKCFGEQFVTWKDIADHYGSSCDSKIFARADEIYEAPSYGTNNISGYMTGAELLRACQAGEEFLVGRQGALRGVVRDIRDKHWEVQKYETNRAASSPPNCNWFWLSEFVDKLNLWELEREDATEECI